MSVKNVFLSVGDVRNDLMPRVLLHTRAHARLAPKGAPGKHAHERAGSTGLLTISSLMHTCYDWRLCTQARVWKSLSNPESVVGRQCHRPVSCRRPHIQAGSLHCPQLGAAVCRVC